MLYNCLKIVVRLAMLLFCRRIIINKPAVLKENGPLLLASNHPNSFLDAVILDALFEKPIWSLARGDVFKSKLIIKILTALRILPVYRVSEGVENLSANYATFESCKKIFRDAGIVLIFSEGRCINEWHLRPLKKGTARLAISSWNEQIPLRILPVGINYSSFRRFGKNIILNFGEIIESSHLPASDNEGMKIQAFNQLLSHQLRQLVYEIDKQDIARQQALLEKKPLLILRIILAIPAFLGMLVHALLYIPVKQFTWKKANHNDHYDSILIALLLFLYPLYLLVIGLTVLYFFNWMAMLGVFIGMPFTAWAVVQVNGQLDRLR